MRRSNDTTVHNGNSMKMFLLWSYLTHTVSFTNLMTCFAHLLGNHSCILKCFFIIFFVQGKWKSESYAGTFQWLCLSAANHFLIMLQVPPLIVAAAAGFYKLGQSQESSRLLKHQTCSGVLSCEREHQIRKRDSARDNRSAPLYSHEQPLSSVYWTLLLDAFSDL